MKKIKTKRAVIAIILIIAVIVVANFLVRETGIIDFKLFNSVTLFSYFGVLIGFALTIYTFGLSMVSDIKKELKENKEFSEKKVEDMLCKLSNGFDEIKEDIWIIFWSLILILFFAVVKEINNPFGWHVEHFKIPQTANLTLFVVTTFSMYDIMKTLFNLAGIKLELIKRKRPAANN